MSSPILKLHNNDSNYKFDYSNNGGKIAIKKMKVPLSLPPSDFDDQNEQITSHFLISIYVAGLIYGPNLFFQTLYFIGSLSITILFGKKIFSKNLLLFTLIYFFSYNLFLEFELKFGNKPQELLVHSFLSYVLTQLTLLLQDKYSGQHVQITKEFRSLFLNRINSSIKLLIFFKVSSFRNYPKWDLISFKLVHPSLMILAISSIICNYS